VSCKISQLRSARALIRPLFFWLLAFGNAAAEPRSDYSDAFTAGVDGYHTYRVPTLVCTQRGTLLLFCDARKNSDDDLGKIDPVMRRSVDGGKSWQPMQVLHTDPGAKTKIGNACAIYDRQTDTVHVIYLYNLTQAFLRSSRDDGVTFDPPRDITAAFREFDYPWAYFATGHVHGIQLRSGRLVAPIWLNNQPRTHESKGQMRNGILYSDDHGRTWHAGGLAAYFHSLNESSVYEASDGSLILNSRTMRTGYRAVTRSSDLGRTWSPPALDRELPDPTCQGSTLILPSQDGRSRVLFANPATQKTRTHLTVRLSYDDGRTWPVAKLVEEGGAAYSDLAVSPEGTIYLAYERTAERPYDRVTVARFDLAWLTDGRDHLGRARR
jgi:sialidase-1